MKPDPVFWRMVRMCWPLFGGAWGAWLVVRRLPGVSINGDSFGGAAFWMFGLFFAIIFLIAGAAIAAVLGRLVEWLLRRQGAGVAGAVTVATLVNALAIWQIGELLQANAPGLRGRVAAKPEPGGAPPRNQVPPRSGCLDPRPTDAHGATIWDAECR